MGLLAASRLLTVGQRVLPLREGEELELHQRSVATSRPRVATALPQHPTPQRTTKKYPPLYSLLPPEIAERLLRRVSGNSCTVGRWKAVEDLPYPPTAPKCGRDVLSHPFGQRKECQGEWRGQVASYRQQAARAKLVFPFTPRGMWTPTAVGNPFPHPRRDSSQVVS